VLEKAKRPSRHGQRERVILLDESRGLAAHLTTRSDLAASLLYGRSRHRTPCRKQKRLRLGAAPSDRGRLGQPDDPRDRTLIDPGAEWRGHLRRSLKGARQKWSCTSDRRYASTSVRFLAAIDNSIAPGASVRKSCWLMPKRDRTPRGTRIPPPRHQATMHRSEADGKMADDRLPARRSREAEVLMRA